MIQGGGIVLSAGGSGNRVFIGKMVTINPCIICKKLFEIIKTKTIKLLGENTGKNLCGLEYAEISWDTKSMSHKRKS